MTKQSKNIGDNIEVPNIGFMCLETWIGKVVGITVTYYIIDLGQETIGESRFQLRERKDYD